MINDYRKISLIIFTAFFLVILSSFQIAILNRFDWGFNIFLILILFLIINKNIYSAFFLGWFGGFLIDTVHFSVFGTSSLVLLILTAFLIVFQKKALITAKTEGVLLIGITAIFFYRFLEWALNIMIISRQEKFDSYFFNFGFLAELLFTAILLMIVFYFRSKFILDNV